jgi:hypothetical protein
LRGIDRLGRIGSEQARIAAGKDELGRRMALRQRRAFQQPVTDSVPRNLLMRVSIGPPSTTMPVIGGPSSLPGGKRFSSMTISAEPIGVTPTISSSSSDTTVSRTPARRKRVSSSSKPTIPMLRMTFDGTVRKARTLDSTKNIGAPVLEPYPGNPLR